MSNCFNPANILLPNDGIDMEKWSVIACDQFTSQADYWDAVEKYVGDAPSTLNVVFPEIYLGTIAKQENDCNSSGEGVHLYHAVYRAFVIAADSLERFISRNIQR